MALVAALVCGPAGAGRAQPGAPAVPAANDAQMTQAKDLVTKAIAKSQAGDHGAAIELYLQAYDIAPLPLLLTNLAAEYQQAQRPVEALKYFCKYLEVDPSGANATYATAQAKVLQTELKTPVDDANVCKPVLPPAPLPTVGSAASLRPPGPVAGVATAPDPGHDWKLTGIGVSAVGGVLVVVGLVYGAKAQSITNEINNHGSGAWPDSIRADEAEGQSDENKQIGFLIIGGAVVLIGTALYVVGHRKTVESTQRQLTVVPTAAPGYGGVSLFGRW